MRKYSLFFLGMAVSFCFGFAFRNTITPSQNTPASSGHVIGIGGVFFKCKDTKKIKEWYKTQLGMDISPYYGAKFEWREKDNPSKIGTTLWTPFNEKTKYFEPSSKEFIINYRVDDLRALYLHLKENGVTMLDSIAGDEYGSFLHIMDPEGNKIELWQETQK